MKTMKYFSICLLSVILAVSAGCSISTTPDDCTEDSKGNRQCLISEEELTTLAAGIALRNHAAGSQTTPGTAATSVDANLQNIVVGGGILSPTFNSYQYYYSVAFSRTANFVQVTVIPRDYGMKLRLNGTLIYPGETYTVPLLSDEEFVEVKSLHEASGTQRSYLVIVRRTL